jgi:hypothetical protein
MRQHCRLTARNGCLCRGLQQVALLIMGPSVEAATSSQALWLPGPSLLLAASAVRRIKAHQRRLPLSASAPLEGISCCPRCSKDFALLGFYEVCSSLTYHEASG